MTKDFVKGGEFLTSWVQLLKGCTTWNKAWISCKYTNIVIQFQNLIKDNRHYKKWYLILTEFTFLYYTDVATKTTSSGFFTVWHVHVSHAKTYTCVIQLFTVHMEGWNIEFWLSWWQIWTVLNNFLSCGNKMSTRCNRWFYCRSNCLLNMFRVPLCPSSGARECYAGGCCLRYLVLWFSSCRYGVELRVMCPVCGLLQQLANRTTGSNRLYSTLELLMMGIIVPETCWESN